jgi:hypothetical protein
VIVINLPRDDLGKQRLEEVNAARNAAQPVASLAAAPALAPHAPPHRSPTVRQATPPVERRHGDRRRGAERRSQAQAVLLDTRSPYPRRTHDRRCSADTGHAQRVMGLDVYS